MSSHFSACNVERLGKPGDKARGMYLLYCREFSGVQLSQIGDLYHFVGLSFMDTCTHRGIETVCKSVCVWGGG